MAALVIKNDVVFWVVTNNYVRGRLLLQCSISVRTVVSSTTVIKRSSSIFRNPSDCISLSHQPPTQGALRVMNFYVGRQKTVSQIYDDSMQ